MRPKILSHIQNISLHIEQRKVQNLTSLFLKLGKESQSWLKKDHQIPQKSEDIFRLFQKQKEADPVLQEAWEKRQFMFPIPIQKVLDMYKVLWQDKDYDNQINRQIFKLKRSIPKKERRFIHLGYLIYADYIHHQRHIQSDLNPALLSVHDLDQESIQKIYKQIEKSIEKPKMSYPLTMLAYGVIGLSLLGALGQSVAVSFVIFHGTILLIPCTILSVGVILSIRFFSSLATLPIFRRLFHQDGRSFVKSVNKKGQYKWLSYPQAAAMLAALVLSSFSAIFGGLMAYKNLVMISFIPALLINPLAIICSASIVSCILLGSIFCYEKLIKEGNLLSEMKNDYQEIVALLQRRKKEEGLWHYRGKLLATFAVSSLNIGLGLAISVMSGLAFAGLLAPVLGISFGWMAGVSMLFFSVNSLVNNYYGTRELVYAINQFDELQNKTTNKFLLCAYALFSAMNVYFPTLASGRSVGFAIGFTSFRLGTSILHAVFPDVSALKNKVQYTAQKKRAEKSYQFFDKPQDEERSFLSISKSTLPMANNGTEKIIP